MRINLTCAYQGVKNVSFRKLGALCFLVTKIRPFLPYYQSNIRTKPKLDNDIETFIYVNNLTSVLYMTQLCYKQRDKMRPRELKHIVPELEIEEN